MFATSGWRETAEMSEDVRADFEMILAFAELLSDSEEQEQ